MNDKTFRLQCTRCGQELKDGPIHQCPLASSEASEGAKPPTREGGGDRVERLDGLHASEASGPASAIQPGGAGKATDGSAAGEALRDERSQLPDGLPSRGDGESERFLLAIADKLYDTAGDELTTAETASAEGDRELVIKHVSCARSLRLTARALRDVANKTASVKPIH